MPIYVCFGWQFNAQKGISMKLLFVYTIETLMRTHSKLQYPVETI